MKPSLVYQDTANNKIIQKETYPFQEFIIDQSTSTTANSELVTWLFPNNEMVQLLFFTPDDAEIFFLSPSVVLPDEGEEGVFYTQNEIKHFLSKVISNEPAEAHSW